MIGQIIPIVSRFLLLLLVQGLLLININIFGGFGHLNLYVLVILLLPIKSPRLLDMIIAFLLGLGVDMFYNSPGLHASALVFVAFVRPLIIRILTPRDDYDFTDRPVISSLGLLWFVQYAGSLLLLHSLWLYALEAFDFGLLGKSVLNALLSTILTLVTIVILDYLYTPKVKL
jgi:rod shape-determining protein MreD